MNRGVKLEILQEKLKQSSLFTYSSEGSGIMEFLESVWSLKSMPSTV